MKTKFLKFVRENWAKLEYASVQWNSDENIGTVVFNDGNEIFFEYEDGEFSQVEEYYYNKYEFYVYRQKI